MTRLIRWAFRLAILYALFVGGLLWARHYLIYPFDQRSAWTNDLPGVVIREIARDDGTILPVWVAEPEPNKPVIFYFMGNVGHLEYFSAQFREFREAGLGLVAMAYRGGGGAEGEPSERALKADAQLIWDRADTIMRIKTPKNQRVIFGFSLGTGIAADLASQNTPGAVVLQAPFTKLCSVIETRLRIVPACQLMWDERYPVIDQVGGISAPLLIQHGQDDDQIPVHMGRELANAAGVEPKIYVGAKHNDLRLFGAGRDAIQFVENVVQR